MDSKNCETENGDAVREHLLKGPCDISDIYGRYGVWQKKLFAFAFFTSLLSSWNNLAMTFFAPDIDYWCAPPLHLQVENDTLSSEEWLRTGVPWENLDGHAHHSRCLMYDTTSMNTTNNRSSVECSEWVFNKTESHSTVVDQWNLVCKQEWLISFTQSMYMAGYMTSMLVFGQLSDRFGRRPVVLIAVCIFILAGFACLQTSHFFIFTGMRFFISLGVSGAGSTSFVLLMETVGPEYRSNLGLGFNYGWATGFVLLPLIAWLIPHWYFLQLTITVPSVCLLIGYWFVPESPRWLMTKMKYKRAQEVISRAAAVNGKDVSEALMLFKQYKERDQFQEEMTSSRATILDLVRTPNMRRKTLNLFFCWFVNSFIYFGLSLNTSGLGGNLFVNFFISGVIEFPAYAIATVVIKKLGRRNPQMAVMIFGGLACFLTITIPDNLLWLRITLATLGKFCITASFGMIYVFSAEIFPTVVRNIGVGCSSTCARIGSMVAPFVKELGRATHPFVPFAVYGGLSLVSGILVYFLPETLGCKLPDTVEEGERFGIQENRSQKDSEEHADHNCQELLDNFGGKDSQGT